VVCPYTISRDTGLPAAPVGPAGLKSQDSLPAPIQHHKRCQTNQAIRNKVPVTHFEKLDTAWQGSLAASRDILDASFQSVG
jgi:hypothetical protein